MTVADATSLDLTTGITLEAWVRPAALGSMWRTVVLKEQPGQLVYALYAGTDTASRPGAHVFTTSDLGLLGPSALPLSTWSHLAMTWDGLTVRVYVNGTQVSSSALAGTAVTSSEPAADRRQRRLAGVVQRADRRGPRLQPRAQRGGDRRRPRHRGRRRGAALR